MNNLTANELRRALALREEIDQLESDLNALLCASSPGAETPRVAASRLPWAIAPRRAALEVAKPAKRTMSEATKARIAASARKRWKKIKAAGKRTLAG